MALQLNDKGPLVKKWQQFLKTQGFLTAEPTGTFGPQTQAATTAFQKFYSIQASGVVGSLTLGKAATLGFNPDNHPQPVQINTDQKMMQWIKNNMSSIIAQAVAGSIYTEDWIAGMCARETGFLFTRKANEGLDFKDICPLIRGDYGKRAKDSQKIYHGFGFWQIDIDSFPAFVNSGKWADPLETAKMAVTVLNGKMNFLKQKGWDQKLDSSTWQRAITAAYNCGEGNVNIWTSIIILLRKTIPRRFSGIGLFTTNYDREGVMKILFTTEERRVSTEFHCFKLLFLRASTPVTSWFAFQPGRKKMGHFLGNGPQFLCKMMKINFQNHHCCSGACSLLHCSLYADVLPLPGCCQTGM